MSDLDTDLWASLVTTYTDMSLTFTSDRLPALSGLAQRIAPEKSLPYLAGLWASDLPHALLWYRNKFPKLRYRLDDWERHDGVVNPPPPNWQAPSWSWASAEGTVLFLAIEASAVPVVEVVDTSIVPAGPDPFGHCKAGSIALRGPLVPAVLRYRDSGWPSRFWLVREKLWFYFWPDVNVSIKDTAAYMPCHSTVYCLEMYRSEEKTWGLVLRVSGNNNYERIGCFRREEHRKTLKPRARLINGKMQEYVGFDSWFNDAQETLVKIV